MDQLSLFGELPVLFKIVVGSVSFLAPLTLSIMIHRLMTYRRMGGEEPEISVELVPGDPRFN